MECPCQSFFETYFSSVFERLKNIGPGAMVAAAFIGPGTITTATLAGANFGYTLLWAVLFSTLATIVLQEMTARLGIVSKLGLGEAIRHKTTTKLMRYASIFLVVGAIGVGNAAYEAGNLTGASIAFSAFNSSESTFNWPVLFLGIAALGVLFTSSFKVLERLLIALIVAMGLLFFVQAILLDINWLALFRGLFIPTFENNQLKLVVGLIGTTIVPYNLFLHASSAKQKWQHADALNDARWDTYLAVGLGGIITLAIVVCAAVVLQPILSAQAETGAVSISTLIDTYKSGRFISLGFFAAGFSSALTAPLAAAYAVSEMLGYGAEPKNWRFRVVIFVVVGAGIAAGFLGYTPTQLIVFAQVANGMLLPIIAIFLLWVMNDGNLMQHHKNGLLSNVLGIIVVCVTLLLSVKNIAQAFGINLF